MVDSNRTPPTRPRILRRHAEASALLDPLRLRLLRHMEFPISASGLARRLRLPRQRVNYHLRELERQGLARLIQERKVGNCTERLVQAVATRFVLSQEMLGGLAAEPSPPAEPSLRKEARFPTEEARRAFEQELFGEVGRLLDKHGTATGGEPWLVSVVLHASGHRSRLPDPRTPE